MKNTKQPNARRQNGLFRGALKKSILGVLSVGCLSLGLIQSASAQERPNIVVIMCDDMGYSDIGCYGGEINTPNLDKLAANGIRYSQMYNTSKCHTSRSSLLTGRYVMGSSKGPNLRVGPTFGEVAKTAGYRTLWSGKNHSDFRPPERGFDRFYGFQGGACNYWNPGNKLLNGGAFPYLESHEWMVDDKWVPVFIPKDPDYYVTDAITDNAIKWLKEYKNEEKPFLLYLTYNAPHFPLHARDEDIAKYKGVYDGGYQQIRQTRYDKMVKNGMIDPNVSPLNPQPIKPWDSLPKDQQVLESKRMEIHAAMVDN
jgi:arylsulfatase A-like enzyme